jgi:hypothetical protein
VTDLSFAAFASAKGFSDPVSAEAVAASMNVNPPISLRELIGTAAPYAPVEVSYATGASGTSFLWYDAANLPPWIFDADDSPYGPPDALRQATSFEFQLWKSPTGMILTDTTIPNANANGDGQSIGYGAGILNGTYTYQITAYNDFGSASTGLLGPIAVTPPAAAPNITAVLVDPASNTFQVHGTGFDAWNGTQVNINVEVSILTSNTYGQDPVPVLVTQGGFTWPVEATVCSDWPGNQLTFSVSQQGSYGSISNLFNTHCPGGLLRGSPRASRAWPLAWPSPSGPPGRQWLRAQGWVPKMLSAERSLRSG